MTIYILDYTIFVHSAEGAILVHVFFIAQRYTLYQVYLDKFFLECGPYIKFNYKKTV